MCAAGGATIWERITRHKAPVIEPRDSGAFAAALADYAAKLEDPSGTGAVLFAVCRGKVGLAFGCQWSTISAAVDGQHSQPLSMVNTLSSCEWSTLSAAVNGQHCQPLSMVNTVRR
jgi:hypothetical protein